MASFGILDASKIIPEFNGDLRQMNNFLGIIEFYSETLKDDAEVSKLIKFVLATKLSDKVRNKLISEETPNSLQAFKSTLNKVFFPKKTLSSVHTELAKQMQGNGSVTQFANKIESLIASLNELQISELGSQNRETIIKMNNQVALSSFKNDLNETYSATVLAARPKSLNEAVHIASEIVSQANSIMYLNRNTNSSHKRGFRNNKNNTYNPGNQFRNNNFRGTYMPINSNNYNNNQRNSNNNYNNNNQRNGNNNNRNNHRRSGNNNRNGNNGVRNQGIIYITQEQGNEVHPCNPQE